MKSNPYLQLDCIKTDVQLMKMLPPDVARRYHALPVATAGGRITIAMAFPEDITASAAVASAIGTPVCFVQANPKEIEQRLDEIWPQHSTPQLRLLLWSPKSDTDTSLFSYSQELSKLLKADLEQVKISLKNAKSPARLSLALERSHPNLFIFQAPNLSLLKQMLLDFASQKTMGQTPPSILVAQNLRWPLATILLTLPDGDSTNNPAVDWAVQLASSSQATVTVLPLLPITSGLDGLFVQHSVQTLLKTKDPLGQKMRCIAQRFSEDGIKGAFKLREGKPQDQLRSEILASDPDLVIIAAEHQNCLWIAENLLAPLLESINQPVLISR